MKFSVLQVGKYYHPYRGGMETYLLDLCQGLKDRTDLRVLVSNTSRRTVREEVDEVDVVRAGSLGRIFSTPISPSFPRLLKELAGDIVTVHHPNPLATLAYLKARPRGKLTVVYQSDIVKQKITGTIYRPLLLKFLKQAEKIVVASPRYLLGSPVLRRFREKCVLIPIGIDLDLFRETEEIDRVAVRIRERLGNRIVLFIGRLTQYKGAEYLVKAMEEVDGHLVMIGSGKGFDALKMMVVSHGLEERISLLSDVSPLDLRAHLRACSVFCLPSISRNEAFGIVQLEAMASSRPVVSTRLDTGVTYTNLDGVTGLVVPPRDSPALAGALNRILDNPALGEELGRRGRQRVEEEFTKEKMAEKTFQMYRELVE